MALRYQIPFTSKAGTKYVVDVYDNNYSGSVRTLIGAAQPFETTEDKSDDWFRHVRKQSGYLRVFDNGKDASGNTWDWRTMMPTSDKSHPVVLRRVVGSTSTVMWTGYLQPQSFSGKLYETNVEREYPVQCPLSVLDGIDIDISYTGIKSFAFLLELILNASGVQWSRIYFSGNIINEWLKKGIDWQNFYTWSEDSEQEPLGSYGEILEETCKFFGWTCRTHGLDIYFVSPDDDLSPTLCYITSADLHTLASGVSVYPTQGTTSAIDIATQIYASTKNEVTYMTGARGIKVEADINRQEVVLKVPFDEVTDMIEGGNVETTHEGEDYTFKIYGPMGPQPVTIDTSKVILGNYMDQNDIRSFFYLLDTHTGDLSAKHDFNWTCRLQVNYYPGQSSQNTWAFKVNSKWPVNFDHGLIYISGRTIAPGNGVMYCRMKIGNNYWNGSSWQQAWAEFPVAYGSEQSEGGGAGEIITTRALYDPYPSYKGYGIPIDSAVGGYLTFEIDRVLNDAENFGAVFLTELELGFVRHLNYAPYNDRDVNIYKASNNSGFKDEKTVNTIFASDNGNAMGLGIILNTDGSYCDGLSYPGSGGGSHESPEQHLADRMSTFFGRTHTKLKLELLTNMAEVTPSTYIGDDGGSYPISISHKWADDITSIIAIDL